MVVDPTQTFMNYLTPTLGKPIPSNFPIYLRESHLTSSMGSYRCRNNLLSGVAYEDHMPHLRKFIKLTNTVRQNHVPADYVRLYAFRFSLNEKA